MARPRGGDLLRSASSNHVAGAQTKQERSRIAIATADFQHPSSGDNRP